ncbi:MAG: peptidoglycan DD-metalloendopeptidase family protein [Lachnospiraceae bacterium]|jgi:murein DD-endopeptidase MepM/ murein hydrolase activator NlpD|nr:peptidoglycan DD-metalloendopeptidase family protein [Lachnospiraceae bacterium]
MKKFIFISIFAIILLAAALAKGDAPVSYASNLTNDTIKKMEEEIANTQSERKKLQDSLTDVQSVRKSLVSARNDLKKFIEELDEALVKIEQHIEELLGLIADKEAEIVAKTAELDEALEVQHAQYEAMKVRIKYMYEQGDTYYLSLLIGAQDLSSMLNRADYIEMLSKYDNDKLNEFIMVCDYVALCKENLEEEKELLDEAKAAVEAEKQAVNELIEEKTAEIEALMKDIARQEQAIREYEADIAEQNEIIKALEKSVAEERARLAAANKRRYDGGKFSWPVPSYTRISEEYGWRVHPILRVNQYHNGIDIAAPTGDAILAAYNGKVIAASYTAAMGNYLVIDHGDSVFTIYLHCSKLLVGEDAEVSKGHQSALVGSTGRSTGPQLHFSVRVNGSYVSPWDYFGGR